MKAHQLNAFTRTKLSFDEAQDILIDSVNAIASKYRHWVFAWSGGKDSTTLVTLIMTLLDTGQIKYRPETIDVLYADTRAELLPLHASAQVLADQLKERGANVHTVMAEMDKRFMVYILGRGVPPPNNNTLRWCTRQIKIDPMKKKMLELHDRYQGKLLSFVGVRQGESAIRDNRIYMSCNAAGTECGTGHLYEKMDTEVSDKIAPILHFRTCTVWDWLKIFAPSSKYGSWHTRLLAEAYGDYGENTAEEQNARTGCNGCPLASKDQALDTILLNPSWQYLRPLKRLRAIYEEMRKPQYRLRQLGGKQKKDGTLAKNQNRMGPITLESRLYFLDQIKQIQSNINFLANVESRPKIDLINNEEEARIRDLIAKETWPQGWTGQEPRAHELFEQHFADGTVQKNLFK